MNRTTNLEGNQQPRYAIVPRSVFTDGILCGELSSSYGLAPDPWQQTVLDGWLACLKDGTYVANTCGLSVPRQNGKNGVLEMVELFKTSIQGRKVLHTAHEVKTCRKAFLRLKGFFENDKLYPELVELVSSIRQTNGQEAIYLKNGGSIEFIARSKSSGRGFTVDDVVCDEAQELTDEQLEVLRPTTAAAPSGNPQIILTGTPTPPGSPGTVMARTRLRAINGIGKRLCWFEWSVDNIGDVRDQKRWAETNPALGYRLQLSVIESELNDMSEDGFARERLGWWAGNGYKKVFDEALWKSLVSDEVPDKAKTSFGVKFSPDGAYVAVSGAKTSSDGKSFVELVFYERIEHGISWLANWLSERKNSIACVAIDGMSGANVLVEKLADRKFPKKAILQTSTKDVVSAATMFFDAVNEHLISHSDQEQLNESALSVEKRDIGNRGGWGFGGDQSLPIESASLAYWSGKTTKRNPGKKTKIL